MSRSITLLFHIWLQLQSNYHLRVGKLYMAKKSHVQSCTFKKGFSMDYCPSLGILDVYLKSSIFNWWHVSNSKDFALLVFLTPETTNPTLQVVSEYDDVTGKMTFHLLGIKCHQLHHFILLDLRVKNCQDYHELLSNGQVFILWGHRDLDLDHQSLFSSSLSPRAHSHQILRNSLKAFLKYCILNNRPSVRPFAPKT